ncbi:MAG: STT3 domain-containing protein, partial [Desulfosudaceae bacterium]
MRRYGKNGKVMAGVLLMALFLAAGFLARMEGLALWQRQPDLFFLADPARPVMIGADSYYYLDLARDLLEGNYQSFDPQRCFPAGARRPSPPPLLSVMLAGLARMLPFPLEWIAAIVPAVLGLLLFWPLYLLGRQLVGRAGGWIAAATGIFWPVYASRSVFGRFDTDCLNVVFASGAAYLALRLTAEENKRKKMVWGAAGVFLYILFLWWWPQVPLEVSGLALFPLVAALAVSFGGCTAGRAIIPATIISLMVGGGILIVAGGIGGMEAVIRRAGNIFAIANHREFPPFTFFSGDQQADLALAWSYLGPAGSLVLAAGLAGLVWLFSDRPRLIPFFLPLMAVAALSFFALRFFFFAAPLVGLGIAYGFQRLWRRGEGKVVSRYVLTGTMGLILIGCLPDIHQNNLRQTWLTAGHYQTMEKIGRVTEDNALIWSSYSKGYPLQFYARRATITDGSYQNGRILYIQNHPLAVDSFRLAANWMQFYAVRGMDGFEQMYRLSGGQWPAAISRLERLLSAGPTGATAILRQEGARDEKSVRQMVRFLFPVQPSVIYLYIDIRQFQESWFQAGAWNLITGQAPAVFVKQYHQVYENAQGEIVGRYPYGQDIIHIDPELGRFQN